MNEKSLLIDSIITEHFISHDVNGTDDDVGQDFNELLQSAESLEDQSTPHNMFQN